MVAPNRELANTLFPLNYSLPSNPQDLQNNIAIDMNINALRGQASNSSTNSSRATSVHSSMSSTDYAERVQALNNNLT